MCDFGTLVFEPPAARRDGTEYRTFCAMVGMINEIDCVQLFFSYMCDFNTLVFWPSAARIDSIEYRAFCELVGMETEHGCAHDVIFCVALEGLLRSKSYYFSYMCDFGTLVVEPPAARIDGIEYSCIRAACCTDRRYRIQTLL